MDPYNPHAQNLYPQQGYSPYQAYPGYNQPNNTSNMNPNNMGAPRALVQKMLRRCKTELSFIK